MTGFSFNGVHSKDIGVTVKTINRAILPAVKQFEVSSPCFDGSLDFSTANEYGREMHEDRIFDVEVSYKAADIHALQDKNSKVAAWLMGKGKLVFDDMPNVYWLARVAQQIDFVPLCLGRATVLKVYFRVNPFAYGIADCQSSHNLNSGTNIITINNVGTWYARPVFYFTSGSNLRIVKDKFDLSVNGSFGNLTVDCEKQSVMNNGAKVSESGTYLELVPGVNDIYVTVTGTPTMTVRFTPRYV